jgi:hypothetical protein
MNYIKPELRRRKENLFLRAGCQAQQGKIGSPANGDSKIVDKTDLLTFNSRIIMKSLPESLWYLQDPSSLSLKVYTSSLR